MFKIFQQTDSGGYPVNLYTIICYYRDENSRYNKEVWSANNLSEAGLAALLQGRGDRQLDTDEDFVFVVLKSGNGPVILTSQGNLMAVPVKQAKKRRDPNAGFGQANKRSVLQAKRRKNISH